MSDDVVVDFPTKMSVTPEADDDAKRLTTSHTISPAEAERLHSLRVEVERLAGMTPDDAQYYIDSVAKLHGITPAKLERLVKVTRKSNETRAREQEKQRLKEHFDRQKAFQNILHMPSAQHDAALVEMAKSRSENFELLKQEFAEYVAEHDDAVAEEMWPEPINTRTLLNDLMAQVRRYVILSDDVALTVTLWTAMSWVHSVATHSPLLVLTSATPGSGKSTLTGTLQYLVPRPYLATELTGPNLYRIVDQRNPTLIIEESDKLFKRKEDLSPLVNHSWLRGATVTRYGFDFNIFCPKLFALNPDPKTGKLNLEVPTLERSIVCWLLKRMPGEKPVRFHHRDTDQLATLRKKLCRWARDHMSALEAADPVMPPGLDGRLEDNWRLLLAIADLAGGTFPERARAAMVRLKPEQANPVMRLFEALHAMFVKSKGADLPSARIIEHLNADKTGEWFEYGGRGRPITQRQVAVLLKPHGIRPLVNHPDRTKSERGYKLAQFEEVFRRYLPHLPPVRTDVQQNMASQKASARKRKRRAKKPSRKRAA